MIRVCPGYETEDGRKIHRKPRFMGVKRPLFNFHKTHGYCFECWEAARQDMRKSKLRRRPYETRLVVE